MKVHVECLPDEALAMALGVPRKRIVHHAGKSRVFAKLQKEQGGMAIVDQDPGAARCAYERALVLKTEEHGMEFLTDKQGRLVIRLSGKLEDWILARCKEAGLKPEDVQLPSRANDLHRVVNTHLDRFQQLITSLLTQNSPGLVMLREHLKA